MDRIEEFAKHFNVTREQAEATLKYHASKWGGCIACAHSLPANNPKAGWLSRSCPFGMRQESCTLFEPYK